TGYTYSDEESFPVCVGPDLTFNGDYDAFVAKVNAEGTGLLYCGYLGGGNWDHGYGIAVDGAGCAYVTGNTNSDEESFPVCVGPDLTYNGGDCDAFVAKVNAEGTELLYCGYLGGRGVDVGHGIAVDGVGCAYVTGYTYSDEESFPVCVGPDLTFNSSNGTEWDAFVAKVEALGGEGLPTVGGTLRLGVASARSSAEPIVAFVRVDNPTTLLQTYRVQVSLLQGASVLETQTCTLMASPGGSSSLEGVNLGTWPAGSYQVVGELWLGNVLLERQGPLGVRVLATEGQRRALAGGAKLGKAAWAELDEMASLVARWYRTSVISVTDEVMDFLVRGLFTCMALVGEAVGKAGGPANSEEIASAEVRKLVQGLSKLEAVAAAEVVDPGVQSSLEGRTMDFVREDLAGQYQAIASRGEEYAAFVSEQREFSWNEGMAQLVLIYQDLIRSRREAEQIWGFGLCPPIRKTTLAEEDGILGGLQAIIQIMRYIALLAAMALIILVFVGLAGISMPALLSSLPSLLHLIGTVKKAGVILLVLLTFLLHLQTKNQVAPAVVREHDGGLSALSERIQESTGLGLEGLQTRVSVQGGRVTFSTELRNGDVEMVRPLVETYLYSVDGRVMGILSQQPSVGAGQRRVLRGDLLLPPGRYRAVTAAHSREKIGLASRRLDFEVSGPRVALDLDLEESQLSPGQAVQARIVLANMDPTAGTGELAVIVESSDKQNVKGWLLELGPGESQELEYSFVAQEEGNYRLRASVSNGERLFVVRDVGYVVGEGAALAVNLAARDVYSPGLSITFPITVSNGGNLPTSTVISLVTMDRLERLQALYTETLAVDVAPGDGVAIAGVVLPAAQVRPGLYLTRLSVGGIPYRDVEFAVEAEDTLFLESRPEEEFLSVGEGVTLTVGVMDAGFDYTDASVEVTVWRPDGVIEPVEMVPVNVGQYEGIITATITGTYIAKVEGERANCRVVGNEAFFVAGERSQLFAELEGRPVLGATRPLTVTVYNERGVPVIGAEVAISGSEEYLVSQSNEVGQAVVQVSAAMTEPYQLRLEMPGFATTLRGVPVWVEPDREAPLLFVNVPTVVNSETISVTGGTEKGAQLMINGEEVMVDSQGGFTATVTLEEGENLLEVEARDAAGNTRLVTQTVTLDTVPPALVVKGPADGLASFQEILSVKGETEPGATVIVSGTLFVAEDGNFQAWVLLRPGVNPIVVAALDAAGNSRVITREVTYLGDEGFAVSQRWLNKFGKAQAAGGWSNQEIYPRLLADVNGDGKADIVGFGNAGVYVSLSTGSGFASPQVWIHKFGKGRIAGGWASQDSYPRLLADVNGDGKADIVGFGYAGVYVSLSTGSGFASPRVWIRKFGKGSIAGGWVSQDSYPRLLADVNGDGKADIVGFGYAGVYVSLSTGSGFASPRVW
ncbi:VCBS repeat-containing protein, partial [bacterium]|nr:VCBS repeat-containing protein [bacterium]